MRKITLLFTMLLLVRSVFAEPFIQQYIPKAKKASSARYSVLIFDVYDATLYTETGKPAAKPPLALELAYLRDFDGEAIADRSAKEMREHQGIDEVTLAGWHSQMRNIFPDVSKGDSITGIYPAETECVFYKNNALVGQIADAEFCNAFFDIWFGENTSAPKLRKQLLTPPSKVSE